MIVSKQFSVSWFIMLYPVENQSMMQCVGEWVKTSSILHTPEVEIWHFLLNWNFSCESRFHLIEQWFEKKLGPEKGKRSLLIHHIQCSNQLCLIICGSSPESIEAYTYPIIQTRLCYQIVGKASNWSLSLQFQLEASNHSKLWKDWH